MAIKTYNKNEVVVLSPNFKSTEFDCHGNGCCSTTQIDEKLIEYAQNIRNHFNKPVTISSGYRCPVHNKNVGGATGSRHGKGQAADIIVKDTKPAAVAQYCESIGILGIGLYETDADGYFVHIDTRTTKSFWYGQAQEKRDTFGGSVIEPMPEEVKLDISQIPTKPADPKVIWDFLKKAGLNDYGIAGLMGNLYAESGLYSCNLQNSYENKIGYKDVEYTAAVDQNVYNNFANDKAGYGLAQWTYPTRKQNLLTFHKKKGVSIGDLETQLEFLVQELKTSYATSVWSKLEKAESVLGASNVVLFKFERPSDTSEKVQQLRASYGQKYYNLYADFELPTVKVGNKVCLKEGAVYASGAKIPEWLFKYEFYVRQIKADNKIVISTSSTGPVTGIVELRFLDLIKNNVVVGGATVNFEPYLIKVTASALNVRSGPSTKHKITTQINKNHVFTIVDEQNGWGKLKSGAGWIHLDYTRKI